MLSDNYDPYSLLGIPHNATQEEIRAAYLQLAKQHHPDISHDDNNEIMKWINAAYDAINTPEKKRSYDETHFTDVNQRMQQRSSGATATPPNYTQQAYSAYTYWQSYGNSAYAQFSQTANKQQPKPAYATESISRGNVFTKLSQFEDHFASIQSASFTADGSLVAIGIVDGFVQVRKVQTGELYAQFALNSQSSGSLLNVKIAPNGATVCAWGYHMGMAVWNTQTRQEIRTIGG